MKHQQIARGALWNATGYVLAGSLAILYPILLLYWLGRSAYGLVSYLALIVNQSYLLNLGLGEAMAQQLTAAASRNATSEGIPFIRSALAGVWLVSLVLSLLWMTFGVEGLSWVFTLQPAEEQLLQTASMWLPPAIWGIQTGMLLGWIPVALGRFRSAAIHSLVQTIWQGLFPLLVLSFVPTKSPELALKLILIGYLLYGLTMWLLTWRWLGICPYPGRLSLLFFLLRKSIWSGLQGIGTIPYTFVERTLIGRWASLSLMGFYSAIHFFLSKATGIVIKGLESLFPVFGSVVDSPTRQALRLSQSVWILSLGIAIVGLGVWGGLAFLLPLLPVHIGTHERIILGMGIGFFITQAPIVPITTFLQSRGYFRTLFWLNLLPIAAVLVLSPVFVAHGLFFLANVTGAVGWMMIYSTTAFRDKVSRVLWYRWVMPTYGRIVLGWAIGTGGFILLPLYIGAPVGAGVSAIGLWGLGIGLLLSERYTPSWRAKRIFLGQINQTIRTLGQGIRRHFLSPVH